MTHPNTFIGGMNRAAEIADEQAANFRRLHDEYKTSDDGNEKAYAEHECAQSVFVLTEMATMLRRKASEHNTGD